MPRRAPSAVSGPVAMIVGPIGQRVDPLADDSMFGCCSIARVTSAAKTSRSTASAEPAGTRCLSAARMISESERAHLLVEQADGIVLGIVGAEAVRADHFGEAVGLVRRRRYRRRRAFR